VSETVTLTFWCSFKGNGSKGEEPHFLNGFNLTGHLSPILRRNGRASRSISGHRDFGLGPGN